MPNSHAPLKQWIISGLILFASLSICFALFFVEKPVATQISTAKSPQVYGIAPTLVSTIPLRFRGFLRSQETIDILAPLKTQVEQLKAHSQAGATFKEGETLVRLNNHLAQKAVYQAESNLAQSRMQLQQFKSSRKHSYQQKTKQSPEKLKQLISQEKLAMLQLETAEKQLKQCHIIAPFDGIFELLTVKAGQHILQGQVMAKLANTEKLQIKSTLSQQYSFLIAPLFESKASDQTHKASILPSTLKHLATIATNQPKELQVKVIHLSQQLNLSQQQDISFSIEQATNLKLGTLVDFEIEVPKPKKINLLLKVPQQQLRKNNTLWLTNGRELLIRELHVIYQNEHDYFGNVTLQENDPPLESLHIITSYLNTAIEGMPIQLIEKPYK